MTVLPTGGNIASSSYTDARMPVQAASSFSELVQRIVQSNSGKQRALRSVAPCEGRSGGRDWGEYRQLAEQAVSHSNFARAEAMWLHAIAEAMQFPEKDWRLSFSLDRLASIYYSEGRYEEAEVFATRALDSTVRVYGDNHLNTAEAYNFLSAVCFNQNRFDDAVAFGTKALIIYSRVNGDYDQKVATALYNLAVISHSSGEFEKADSHYRRCYQIRTHLFGDEHDATMTVRRAYQELLVDRKNHEEAVQIVDMLLTEQIQ